MVPGVPRALVSAVGNAMHELYFFAARMGLREIVAWTRVTVDAALRGRAAAATAPAPAHVAEARDIRLDLFRGLALWFIFLDHIPGNVASWITLRNYGFSDATEIFVFISGYTAALVYGKAMRRHGAIEGGARILKRAWQIYVAHLFLLVIYAALVAQAAASTGHPQFIDKYGLAGFFKQPDFMFIQALLLRFKPVNMDVLPMYIAVMAAFPPVLWLLLRRADAALIGSLALYALARGGGWNLASASGGTWYFNPFAWQLLFVFGAWCALGGAERLGALIRSRLLAGAAAAYLLFALAIAMTWHVHALGDFVPTWLAALIYPIDKTNLDVLRIAHFLALALVIVRWVGRDAPILKSPLMRPVTCCGMHSLEIFCLGVVLSFAAHVALVEAAGGPALQILASAAGIATMVAVATLIAWWGGIDEQKRARSATDGALEPAILARA